MGYASQLEEAFNSMLRTDYIPLQDTDRLSLLADYYVDYMGYVGQILGPVDQLIVGRRGTGKTTLLYRALVECMRSWGDESAANMAKPRTLGVYIDLNKCQSINSSRNKDYEQFEYAFVSELCDSIREELTRSWPELTQDTSLFDKIFKAGEVRRSNAVNAELRRLADILQSGVPRFVDKSRPVEKQETVSAGHSEKAKLDVTAGSSKFAVGGGSEFQTREGYERVAKTSEVISYRLSVADLLRVIGQLRAAAGVPHFLIFVDEFSSLDKELQGRFTTLLKKILGNHSGVFVKLGAITDNYRLGSSIILQRDLFELSLDLDAYVERSGNLTAAMEGLERLTENIILQRLRAYNIEIGSRLFDSPEEAWRDLSRAAMGVPRTLGIVLKQAWHRSQRPRIRRTDLEYGVRYASRAYLNQMLGSSRGGVAIPAHIEEIWDALTDRAIHERAKSKASPSSHFVVLPRHEEKLKYLNMFFLIHLLEQGRTTKKEKLSRSLYSFDYGVCLENNLDWTWDKNVIRQQRFAYDDTLAEFDRYYRASADPEYKCPECGSIYPESQLQVAGTFLTFCPGDKAELSVLAVRQDTSYTEEEIKIIGAIRSARVSDELVARQIADDVGCYIQKVAKFGEKLDREDIINRRNVTRLGKNIYYFPEQ